MAGPGMNYESAFYRALDRTRSCEVQGDVLTLRDEDGKPVVAFRARSRQSL